jgi:hypothetical protein
MGLARDGGGPRMISKSARIGTPVVGFTFGLLATYTLADAGPQPVPARILIEAVGSRIPIGAAMRLAALEGADLKFAEQHVSFRDPVASFDDRFAGAVTQSGPRVRIASLEMPVHFNSALSDTDLLKFAALRSPSGAGSVNGRSDPFDARFSGTTALATAVDTKKGVDHVTPSNASWVVQLIGDDSEAVALSRFRELQDKHKSLLGMYRPVVLNTTITPESEPIWTRVRVELSSRQAAESLCLKLEEAGERCIVQRNVNS